MKKLFLVLIILMIVGICIPAVSAYDYSETFTETWFKDGWAKYTNHSYYEKKYLPFNSLYTNKIQDFIGIKSIVTIIECKYGYFPDSGAGNSTSFVGYIGDTQICSGTIGYNVNLNPDGSWKNTIYYIMFDDFDPKQYSGPRYITLEWDTETVPIFTSGGDLYRDRETPNSNSDGYLDSYIAFSASDTSRIPAGISTLYYLSHDWSNTVGINDYTNYLDVYIEKQSSASYVNIVDSISNDVLYSKTSTIDESVRVYTPNINISITSLLNTYYAEYSAKTGGGPTPPPTDDASVTVYIKNSQTGALIANANVAIDALVDGEYYPVTNRTEPSGIFTITLQPTGGGKPNPDGYRLIVTADGYNNPMPEINFTVDDYKNYIHCLLDPIAGGPVNENKTFIDFFVRDMSSNPISGATVKFGKYTLITNSAGYTVFEVDKNNNYSWTISKSGYGPLTGNAVIGSDPRHTINTVLAPIVTPTTPTSIPTSPSITPTSTLTAPTGEPVSNWLEWFAAHFGMILGGGVEIGKIFMWLCFTVPVGVYVGKEAKAGAAGFMAGAGIVTLFFVLIGWVPIWLVVLLALIIGLLYAKVFNTPDNGGGR